MFETLIESFSTFVRLRFKVENIPKIYKLNQAYIHKLFTK